MTVAMLMEQTFTCACQQQNIDPLTFLSQEEA